MKEKIYKGIYGIVLTPFDENGKVDYKILEKFVEKTSESDDINGLVVCGSTGEFSRLSFDENVGIMKTVSDVIKGKKQFICGATAGDSYTASKYVEEINRLEADGVLLAPPYYFSLSQDEICAYYDDVINNNSRNTPIIGYNIPQCTNPVSISIFKRLLNYDCVKGFKNSWNDMQEITSEIALRNEFRTDVSMLTGLDACLYGTLSLGGDGLFTAISYLMPEVMNYIYQNFNTKKELSFKCQCDLLKLIEIVNQFTFPYGYRVLSQALGMPLGEGREAVPKSIANQSAKAVAELKRIYKEIRDKYIK